jgi:hypothetical protein
LVLLWGCFEGGGKTKCAACALAIEIHFFVRWGVLIFLLRWLVCLHVKLMCPEVELLFCMFPHVKMFGRVGEFNF